MLVKFLLSILFFIALSSFSVDCCAQQPQCQVQNVRDYVRLQYDIIYDNIFEIRFPSKIYERVKGVNDLPPPLFTIYKYIRERIDNIVHCKDLADLLDEETFLFKLVFWAIYSRKKVSPLLNEIQYLDDESQLSQDQLTKLSEFASKGLDKAFQRGVPAKDMGRLRAQISKLDLLND
jgi:hypothetical protein